jgi:hypothetical protein
MLAGDRNTLSLPATLAPRVPLGLACLVSYFVAAGYARTGDAALH